METLPVQEIDRQLDAVEAERDVRIVYAVESGSRAWGFASADSDYDVRFLYVHEPTSYLRINERRDVIERPISDEIDLSGWDLRKALSLLLKSNPGLCEWLDSPLVYRDRHGVATALRTLLDDGYSPRAGVYHYLSMARHTVKKRFSGPQARPKDYFYVLRALLAAQWIDAEHARAPVKLGTLLDRFLPDGPVREAVDQLLDAKRSGSEMGTVDPIPVIQSYIDATYAEVDACAGTQPKGTLRPEDANARFRTLLREVWPDASLWQPVER